MRAEEEADSRWLFKSAKAVRKEVDTDQPISYQPFDWRRYGEAKPASADPSTGRPVQVR